MKQCLHLLNCIDSFKEQGGIPNVFLSHLCILLIWPHQSSSNSSHAPHLQPPMPFLKHNILLLFLNRSHIIKPRNKGGFNHRFSPRADLSPSLAATAVSHCLSGLHKPEEHQVWLLHLLGSFLAVGHKLRRLGYSFRENDSSPVMISMCA